MTTFSIIRPRGFRLVAATSFFSGFVPGSGMAAVDRSAERLTLAFRLDRTFEPVVVSLREEGRRLIADLAGTKDEAAVEKQLARILGLEGDADSWALAGERDRHVGRLQRAFPGFFTATKPSPYDAAVWAIIAPRMNMKQAAKVKLAMARELGDRIALGDQVHHVFPRPERLLELTTFAGLSDEKVARLRGVADAALRKMLDAERLRALAEDDALRELQTIRGIGPWAASHVYFRGAAPIDALPTAEPRVLHGLAALDDAAPHDEATFRRIAERWRPFRMWVCVLLSRYLAQTDGWRAPGLAAERAQAGKRLSRELDTRTRMT